MISIQVSNTSNRSNQNAFSIASLRKKFSTDAIPKELESEEKQRKLPESAVTSSEIINPIQAAIKLEDYAVDAGLHDETQHINTDDKNKNKHGGVVQKLSVKTTKLFDVTANNHGIAKYCECLVDMKFDGQCEGNVPKTRLSYFLDEPDDNLSLATFLQSMDSFLRSFSTTDDILGDEEEFLYYLQGLMEKRGKNEREVFINDAKRFLKIYKARGLTSEQLNHLDYWGSRQQLLAGKVISDFVDILHGPLDPVFGVLLCPVAGRAGPGDSGIVHQILFDVDGPLAYHSAVHDAFGYLISFHDIGPGYNYIGAETMLEATQCMSGQVSGLYFWRQLLRCYKASTYGPESSTDNIITTTCPDKTR